MCLAIPGQILSVDTADALLRTGRVSFGGIVKEVSLALTPEAEVGQYVLVHAGVAIGTVREEEARRAFEYLEAMGELEDAAESGL